MLPALSSLLDRFQPSAISDIFTLTATLKAQGQKIYDLSTGEPDFDTPQHIKDAAVKARSSLQTAPSRFSRMRSGPSPIRHPRSSSPPHVGRLMSE